ncbi:hypothetical protein GTP45_04940 [Pseudoduganella sp. FT55W]|uniref:Uncharacterized protein n=1 Tax=Duganella rivi TaxID=2666083 RepID=A0A7X4GMM6_9BURK|nr:hypothetical protein [Duganella rivi]MYM66183.1 hypothetical protein [Duganella rivi]
MRNLQAQLKSVALTQAVVHQEIADATNLHRLFPVIGKKSYYRQQQTNNKESDCQGIAYEI